MRTVQRIPGTLSAEIVQYSTGAFAMNNQTEGLFAIIAALIVLFSAMLNPIVSVVISVAALGVYGVYKLTARK
jgi:multisubunit Na+/H+ antiporter MnhG subunit